MKLLPILFSSLVLLLFISFMSNVILSEGSEFQWSYANPMEAMEGLVFTLSFGFGFPAWLACFVIIAFLCFLWYLLFIMFRKIFMKAG